MFQQLLREENIFLDVQAAEQEDALREVVNRVPEWALTPEQRTEALGLLNIREKFGTTAIGDGLAFPHCYIQGLKFPLAVLAISQKGIEYRSLDGAAVNVIFMLILPQEEAAQQEKQRIVHAVQQVLSDAFLRERVKCASSPEEAFEWLLREEHITYPGLQQVS